MREDMMSQAPPGWSKSRIEDAAIKVQDGTHFSPESTDGPFRYVTSKNVRFGFLDFSNCGWISKAEHDVIYRRCDVRLGDVLFTKDGANTGNAALNTTDEPFSLLSSVALIRCAEPKLHNAFLLHSILADDGQKRLKDLMSGNAIPRLTLKKIKDFELLLPPVQEQNRIAEILDTLDEAIREAEAVIAKLRQVKAGLLHDLLTRGLDEHGHLRDPIRHPEQFQNSPLGLIPKAWGVTRLVECAEFITSGSRGWASYYSKTGALFIRIGNLTRQHINLRFDDCVFVTPPFGAEGNRTRVQEGDLLISITADLGITGVVNSEVGEAYVNQHIALTRLVPSVLNPRWAGHYLAAEPGRIQFAELGDTGAKAGLSLPGISRLLVAKPALEEQMAISRILDEADRRVETEKEKLAKMQSLKRGLSHDLLTGRKRVKI